MIPSWARNYEAHRYEMARTALIAELQQGDEDSERFRRLMRLQLQHVGDPPSDDGKVGRVGINWYAVLGVLACFASACFWLWLVSWLVPELEEFTR